MDIEFLILADAVEATNGKLYMLGGGWDRWTSAAYPSPIQMGIAVGMLVPWEETNERQRITVTVVDADGNEILPPISGEIEVGRPPGLTVGASQRSMIAINAGFPIQRPGRYEVIVAAPNGVEKRVTFEAAVGGPGTVRVQQ